MIGCEHKMRKGQECTLKTMTPDDWLQLELLRGVNDTILQKRLLQERSPTLISIATQWQSAENAQISFGK